MSMKDMLQEMENLREQCAEQREIALRAAREAGAAMRERDALRRLVGELARFITEHSADDAAYKIERLEADVKHLNQILRDKGLGQGEIDAWAHAIEERGI